MIKKGDKPSNNQLLFRNMVLGILLYSVVLGFFNDYTNILHTGTYSVTFALAILMQILTYFTFKFKDAVVIWFRKNKPSSNKIWLICSVWLIMFISKFIFLGAISVVFRKEVKISGFIGLLVIIICLTITQKIIELIYTRLGE